MRRFAQSLRLVLLYLLAATLIVSAVVWVMRDWQRIRSLCTLKPTQLASLLRYHRIVWKTGWSAPRNLPICR